MRISEIKRKSIIEEILWQYDDEQFGQQLMRTLRGRRQRQNLRTRSTEVHWGMRSISETSRAPREVMRKNADVMQSVEKMMNRRACMLVWPMHLRICTYLRVGITVNRELTNKCPKHEELRIIAFLSPCGRQYSFKLNESRVFTCY